MKGLPGGGVNISEQRCARLPARANTVGTDIQTGADALCSAAAYSANQRVALQHGLAGLLLVVRGEAGGSYKAKRVLFPVRAPDIERTDRFPSSVSVRKRSTRPHNSLG